MRFRPLPPLEVLRDLYVVDEQSITGLSHRDGGRAGWMKTKGGRRKNRNYWVVDLHKRKVPIHRIIFALHHGRDSALLIDHRDGNPMNNRIGNLREATHSQNTVNTVKSWSATGLRGIYPADGSFQVKLSKNGKNILFGRRKTLEEAVALRNEASRQLHGEFSNDIHHEPK